MNWALSGNVRTPFWFRTEQGLGGRCIYLNKDQGEAACRWKNVIGETMVSCADVGVSWRGLVYRTYLQDAISNYVTSFFSLNICDIIFLMRLKIWDFCAKMGLRIGLLKHFMLVISYFLFETPLETNLL